MVESHPEKRLISRMHQPEHLPREGNGLARSIYFLSRRQAERKTRDTR
jgi:hypothetical protein